MPIIRYFVFASCFVVALLFALDHSLAPLGAAAAGPEVDRSIIRIHSARAWPEKIIFDTSTQIAATVSTPLLAAESPKHATGDTFAMTEPAEPETKITPALQPTTARTTSLRSGRTAHTASSHRLHDRQVMVGAF